VNLFGIMLVRNEGDIIRSTVEHCFAQGFDHLVVYDNRSLDDTLHILESFGDRITVLNDSEPGYYQSKKMTELAHLAGRMGADWIVPVDADEFWYSPHGTVKEVLERSPCDVECAYSFEQYGDYRSPTAKRLCKVAFRYRPGLMVAQGNHDVLGAGTSRGWDLLEIREYQYRTLRQTIRKVRNGKAAYDATDLHPMEGAHWREMGGWTDQELEQWWDEHLAELTVWDPPPFPAPSFPTTATTSSSPTV